MSEIHTENSKGVGSSADAQTRLEEVLILDLLIVLAKNKKYLLGLPFLAAVLTAAWTLTLPDIYTASTRIFAPQAQGSASAMLAQQFGNLAGLAGGMSGLKNPNDLYIGMMRSRTVADNIIGRFQLDKVYQQAYQSNTRKRLEQVTLMLSGKDGIITIEVDDKDPKLAASLANAYVEELFNLSKVLAVTEASQRRLFFERQLAEAKQNLISAEVGARQALETGGLVQVEGQGRALVEMTGRIRGQIAVKEVQIGAMRTFAAERNPDLRLAQQELEALKRELAKIEGPSSARSASGAGTAKGSGINNVSLLRDVKYYETIYELLAKQFELAKIDEAKDSSVIQVIDKAVEPDRKSKPKRAITVLLSATITGFAVVIWIFLRLALSRLKGSPAQSERLEMLLTSLGWRRKRVD